MGNQLCNRLARIIGAQEASPMARALSPRAEAKREILGRRAVLLDTAFRVIL